MASAIFPPVKSPFFETATITHWTRAGKYGVHKRQAWGSVEYFINPYDHPDAQYLKDMPPNDMSHRQKVYASYIEIATDEAISILENLLSFAIIGEQLKTDELVVGAIAGEFQHRAENKRASADYLANQFSLIDWQKVFEFKMKRSTAC